MLEYDGININKTNASKGCDFCHYWYLLDKSFKYNHIFAMAVMI